MKHLIPVTLCLAALFFTTQACDRSRLSGGAPDAALDSGREAHKRPGRDPMEFVILHAGRMSTIIEQHPGDCEGALVDLLRYLADNRHAFFANRKKHPAGQASAQFAGKQATQLLMNFTETCPAQAARLNQALHALAD